MAEQKTKVPIREFSRSLPMALLRAREAVMRHFRASLQEQKLTEQQWRVLRALNSVEEVEVTELARLTFLHGPSLTRILRDLKSRRLVKRKPAAHDRRINMISIAQAGTDIIAAVAPRSEGIYAEISRRFGADELVVLQKLLGQLESTVGEGPVFTGARKQ